MIYLMSFYHLYILYFIVYTVFYTVNRSGIDLNKDDIYIYNFYYITNSNAMVFGVQIGLSCFVLSQLPRGDMGHKKIHKCIAKLNYKLNNSNKGVSDSNNKQRFLTPGHQGWNDLHSLCRIGMEYYLLNNDDNNIIYWIMVIIMIMMMIIIMIIMMTMMIIGTATIMIMIIIITTTLTMTIMKMIMIKTAQTPCQSLYKDRRI